MGLLTILKNTGISFIPGTLYNVHRQFLERLDADGELPRSDRHGLELKPLVEGARHYGMAVFDAATIIGSYGLVARAILTSPQDLKYAIPSAIMVLGVRAFLYHGHERALFRLETDEKHQKFS
ncbi:hypothetical protein KW787_03740 [Candidatus Pacearchaeota archaeon]|nr:hypothetical protein [Candidatus Pacearchaeota archaeon]